MLVILDFFIFDRVMAILDLELPSEQLCLQLLLHLSLDSFEILNVSSILEGFNVLV